jgi:hypothetical protein
MNPNLESDLQNETYKWLEKAEDLFSKISPKDNRFADNIAAYISDSRYFMDKGDLIRSFEAVIWAWAWMEICQDMGVFRFADE